MTCRLPQWRRPAGLLALAGLAACGDPRAGQYVGDTVTRTDFEDLAGWGSDVNALTTRHAHSGSQATFVGPDREYGLTYRLPLGRASVHPLKGLDVSAWVYLPSGQADAALTVQVFAPGGGPALYNESLRLLDQVHTYGEWQPVQHQFVLPAGLPLEAELRCYLYRSNSAEPVYLDDLYLKARE